MSNYETLKNNTGNKVTLTLENTRGKVTTWTGVVSCLNQTVGFMKGSRSERMLVVNKDGATVFLQWGRHYSGSSAKITSVEVA